MPSLTVGLLTLSSMLITANLKAGKYLLRLSWPKRCVLSYRLDLSQQSMDQIKVIMDAECAHYHGKIRDRPSN